MQPAATAARKRKAQPLTTIRRMLMIPTIRVANRASFTENATRTRPATKGLCAISRTTSASKIPAAPNNPMKIQTMPTHRMKTQIISKYRISIYRTAIRTIPTPKLPTPTRPNQPIPQTRPIPPIPPTLPTQPKTTKSAVSSRPEALFPMSRLPFSSAAKLLKLPLQIPIQTESFHSMQI